MNPRYRVYHCNALQPLTAQRSFYLSVVDVIEVLTESPRPRKYWNALKTKLAAEGSELSQNMGQLKLPSSD